MSSKNKKKETEIILVKQQGINISKYHLSFLYVLISWPIIYVISFVTRPKWMFSENGFLTKLEGGSGVVNTGSDAGFTNTVLSDSGRENLLWISFLFALIVGLFVYIILGFY